MDIFTEISGYVIIKIKFSFIKNIKQLINYYSYFNIFKFISVPFQVTILRKILGNSQESFLGIRGNSQESFTGKSGENVDSFSQEFLVTISEEILVTLSKEFLVTNSREFLVTNSSGKPEKICSKKVFRTNSWEFPWNYSQDFLKNSSRIS